MEICAIGERALHIAKKQAFAPCPFLEQTGVREFKCRIILADQKAGESELAATLGIGKGCCADAFMFSQKKKST
jgi:hypothetical protein